MTSHESSNIRPLFGEKALDRGVPSERIVRLCHQIQQVAMLQHFEKSTPTIEKNGVRTIHAIAEPLNIPGYGSFRFRLSEPHERNEELASRNRHPSQGGGNPQGGTLYIDVIRESDAACFRCNPKSGKISLQIGEGTLGLTEETIPDELASFETAMGLAKDLIPPPATD